MNAGLWAYRLAGLALFGAVEGIATVVLASMRLRHWLGLLATRVDASLLAVANWMDRGILRLDERAARRRTALTKT